MNRQDILEHAVRTLDDYGFADLSMRRLATSLGVQPGALYWHFANKQSLLLAIAQLMLAEVDQPPTPQASWEPVIRHWAGSLRRALLAHRDGAELFASVLALRPDGLDPTLPCVTALHAAGLGEDEAGAAGAALVHYVVGHTVDAQNHAQARALGVKGIGGDGDLDQARRRFDYGLDLLVDGLRVRLHEHSSEA